MMMTKQPLSVLCCLLTNLFYTSSGAGSSAVRIEKFFELYSGALVDQA